MDVKECRFVCGISIFYEFQRCLRQNRKQVKMFANYSELISKSLCDVFEVRCEIESFSARECVRVVFLLPKSRI